MHAQERLTARAASAPAPLPPRARRPAFGGSARGTDVPAENGLASQEEVGAAEAGPPSGLMGLLLPAPRVGVGCRPPSAEGCRLAASVPRLGRGLGRLL
jgi:hypothetical protein